MIAVWAMIILLAVLGGFVYQAVGVGGVIALAVVAVGAAAALWRSRTSP
jgi:hypothetical protein